MHTGSIPWRMIVRDKRGWIRTSVQLQISGKLQFDSGRIYIFDKSSLQLEQKSYTVPPNRGSKPIIPRSWTVHFISLRRSSSSLNHQGSVSPVPFNSLSNDYLHFPHYKGRSIA